MARRGALAALLAAAAACAAASWSSWLLAPAFAQPARRAVLLGAAGALAGRAQPAVALDPCVVGANNCWSTASRGQDRVAPWKFPAGADKAAAAAALREVLNG